MSLGAQTKASRAPPHPSRRNYGQKYVLRGKTVEGVFQRCNKSCPAHACNAGHNWRYSIELPAVDGHRRVIRKGGFPTGKYAADARGEMLRKHRYGMQPKNHKLTVEQ